MYSLVAAVPQCLLKVQRRFKEERKPLVTGLLLRMTFHLSSKMMTLCLVLVKYLVMDTTWMEEDITNNKNILRETNSNKTYLMLSHLCLQMAQLNKLVSMTK